MEDNVLSEVSARASMPQRALYLTLLALCACVAPAGAQGEDTVRLSPAPAPPLDSTEPLGEAFWERARAQARAFRDVEGGARTFAQRYGVSPEMARMVLEAARAEGVDPDLGFRLVRVESVFRPNARSPRGALGLTQLMPSTARSVDRSLRNPAAVLEPRTNLRVGFRYLRRLIDRYDGDVRLALLAYNRGEGTVGRLLRRGVDPENGYSRKVLGSRSGDPYRGKGTSEARPSPLRLN